MGNLRYLTKEGFRNLKVNKLMTVASITVLFSCLMLIGIAFMLLVNIQSFISGIENENVIMVYADFESSDYDYTALGKELKEIDNVASVEEVVSKIRVSIKENMFNPNNKFDFIYDEIFDVLDMVLEEYNGKKDT